MSPLEQLFENSYNITHLINHIFVKPTYIMVNFILGYSYMVLIT